MTVTIWHNPACGTSRNALAMIRASGEEPVVIEYLEQPPTRERLAGLIAAAGLGVREAIRQKGTPYAELGLDEAALGALGRLAPGVRRDLFAPLSDLSLEAVNDRAEPALRLSFTLPAGGYATEVIRQLTHEPFLAPPKVATFGEPEATADSTDDE